MSDINLSGLAMIIFSVGLALFFALAALISFLGLRISGDRARWQPRVRVSLLFAGGALLLMVVPTTPEQVRRLDDSVQLWVPGVVVLWLAVNVWLSWRVHSRARRPPAG